MLGSTSGPGPHAVAHAKENGDVTVDVEYAVTGQDMGAVVDNIHMVRFVVCVSDAPCSCL